MRSPAASLRRPDGTTPATLPMFNRDGILVGAVQDAGFSRAPVDALMRGAKRSLDAMKVDDERWLRHMMPGNTILTSDTLRDESTAGRGYELEDDDAGRWLRERESAEPVTVADRVRDVMSRMGTQSVRAKDVAKAARMAPRAVTRALLQLQRSGVVTRYGATNGATYSLVA